MQAIVSARALHSQGEDAAAVVDRSRRPLVAVIASSPRHLHARLTRTRPVVPLFVPAGARNVPIQIIAEALIALVICTVGASWWAGSFKRILAAPTLWARSDKWHSAAFADSAAICCGMRQRLIGDTIAHACCRCCSSVAALFLSAAVATTACRPSRSSRSTRTAARRSHSGTYMETRLPDRLERECEERRQSRTDRDPDLVPRSSFLHFIHFSIEVFKKNLMVEARS